MSTRSGRENPATVLSLPARRNPDEGRAASPCPCGSTAGVNPPRNVEDGRSVGAFMDAAITSALEKGGIVDITTKGRKSGQPRRIEIYLHNLDGDLYLTGRPGFPRDWVANIAANPATTIHLKRGVSADVATHGTVIRDPEAKADIILRARVESWNADPDEARADLDHWVETAPLVRLDVDS